MSANKKLSVSLCAAVLLLLWFGATIVRVENERYALLVGMCRLPESPFVDFTCLRKVETRNSPWWHLFYALKN